MTDLGNYLVFGATGSIGKSCLDRLATHGNTIAVGHDLKDLENGISSIKTFQGVVWAQGVNLADSITALNLEEFQEVIDVNVTFILKSLKILLDKVKLEQGAQLVVLSSIWSSFSRPNKLSYGISKAAVGGLIRSLAVDLGSRGIQVNSVSPGPIDTPMTRKNMDQEELERVISESPLRRLVSLDEVASVVCSLATGKLAGMTGQEIILDGGWSVSKLV